MLEDRKLRIEVTPEAKQLMAAVGYDPAYGARPLKRAIQRLLQNPLSLALLEGEYGEGDTVVVRRISGKDELSFERASSVEPVGA